MISPIDIELANKIKNLIDGSKRVLIVQPDNPDGDSMGSALAMEQILMLMDKETEMVCGIKIPDYLAYLPGWDRVSQEVSNNYDLAILLDTSSLSLIENFTRHEKQIGLSKHPLIVIDHHATKPDIDFASVMLVNPDAAATSQVIYALIKQLDLKLNGPARNALTASILSDTLGLTTDNVSAQTMFTVAELVEQGVSLSDLETARRSLMRKSPELVHYKGQLLERIQYFEDDRIAFLSIPWDEIERYSPLYNPPMLVLEDMRLTTNTDVAIVLKLYPEGKVTAKIRSNHGYPVAGALAEAFGGGGHEYAAGFKLTDGRDPEQLIKDMVSKASQLLKSQDQNATV
ncbi:MAG: DHH family phosphoesterase [Candidatus Saccharimonadales bacterium]